MTTEEMTELIKLMNASKPQVHQTLNFNGPVGQQIAHVDRIDAHFDRDMKMQITNAEEINGIDSTDSVPENDDVANRDTIVPADCTAALVKVLVPTFTINSVVLNSMQQLIKASAQINLSSNSEVAMLMAIGQEVNAVRPGCNCPDFVRALIGMGVIAYVDKNAIDKMAGGMTKKLNGYTKGGTKYPPLPANHLHWNSNDMPIGIRIYEAIKSQG